MSHGRGSHRRLNHIVDPLAGYVNAAIRRLRRPPARAANGLAAPFELAWLRGEAILRIRFFAYFESCFGIDEADRLLSLWQEFVVARGHIADLVRRIQLPSALATQSALPTMDDETAYRLYCGLLDDLARNREEHYLALATDDFFRHRFMQQYPRFIRDKEPAVKDVRTLRLKAGVRLSRHLGLPVEIRESFTEDESAARFHLRYKPRGGTWIDLPELVGPRLRPLRLSAYQALLHALKNGLFQGASCDTQG